MKIKKYKGALGRIVYLALAVVIVCAPLKTSASNEKLTCSLRVTTEVGSVVIDGEKDVLLRKGSAVQIAWESTGATKAKNEKGVSIALSGAGTTSPNKTVKYTYRFSNKSKSVTCSATVHVVEGSIATTSLTSQTSKPTITGKISGVKTIQLKIYKEGSTKAYFSSSVVKVKNGSWKTKILKKLPDGNYIVNVLGEKNMALNTIVSGKIHIGSGVAGSGKSSAILVVESVPLLGGGTIQSGATAPVSYLQVINIGKEIAQVKGFWVKQNGSAPTESIIGLTIVDDTESARGSIGGTEGAVLFKNGSALVPIDASLLPGQMRLFTIKAVLTKNLTPYLGRELKIIVTSMDTTASVKSQFPIYGTTWTFVH